MARNDPPAGRIITPSFTTGVARVEPPPNRLVQAPSSVLTFSYRSARASNSARSSSRRRPAASPCREGSAIFLVPLHGHLVEAVRRMTTLTNTPLLRAIAGQCGSVRARRQATRGFALGLPTRSGARARSAGRGAVRVALLARSLVAWDSVTMIKYHSSSHRRGQLSTTKRATNLAHRGGRLPARSAGAGRALTPAGHGGAVLGGTGGDRSAQRTVEAN